MAKDTATALNKNRRIRQEALREQLSMQGHEQHISDIVGKLSDESQEIDANMVNRYKITIDTKLKLMNKYIPDLKQTDMAITGADGEPLELDQMFTVEFVNAPPQDK